LVTVAADFVMGRIDLFANRRSRLILLFTLPISEVLLLSYRLLFIRKQRYNISAT
jgi:hypothetical protein